jgi:hypothetical protein
MNDEDQQQAADHGIEGGQGEDGEDAPRGDADAQGLGIERCPDSGLPEDQREEDQLLHDPIGEQYEGDAAADRGQQRFKGKAAAQGVERQKESKKGQAQDEKALGIGSGEIKK